jgi:hypothetical protein
MKAAALDAILRDRERRKTCIVHEERLNCNEAVPYPPNGQAREWWQRLRSAFGTASSAFVQGLLGSG